MEKRRAVAKIWGKRMGTDLFSKEDSRKGSLRSLVTVEKDGEFEERIPLFRVEGPDGRLVMELLRPEEEAQMV